jgi:hypothetical protein
MVGTWFTTGEIHHGCCFFWGGFKSKATHPDLANKKGKFTDPNGDLKGVQPIDKNKHKTWWDG